MTMTNKSCTGYRCDISESCPYFMRTPLNNWDYMSPLATRDECPYWPPADQQWGNGPEIDE